jgi:Glycosyl transferase family 2/Lysylphosphatidylglycerol synthase TM region
VLLLVAAGGLAGWRWLRRLSASAPPGRAGGVPPASPDGRVGLPGPLREVARSSAPGGGGLPSVAVVVAGAAAAWVLESAVVWQAAGWAGIHLDPVEALMVTVVSVAAQVVAVAPGGIGTYEAAAVAAYLLLGQRPGPALAAAVAAHAAKTAYALVAGAVAVFVPAPGEFGRLRLAAVRGRPAATPAGRGPVVLFLPARDEEATIARVLGRAPAAVRGHPVVRLVIDDHSRDRTAARAAGAGAEVLTTGPRQGLGAAVRRGLAEVAARDAVAVAFCDADGEYDPLELERLVGPILEGQADYVVGSRFAGRIERMLPHRRLGNRVLTGVLAFVARAEIGDGQSGFRALSGPAAADAEVVHDYNYAQVLTLDLLGKGYRYLEVPISYRFRDSGRSFVRLGAYLRRVAPAVWRELNLTETAGSPRCFAVQPAGDSGHRASPRPRGG